MTEGGMANGVTLSLSGTLQSLALWFELAKKDGVRANEASQVNTINSVSIFGSFPVSLVSDLSKLATVHFFLR
jgi:hypothetical protein